MCICVFVFLFLVTCKWCHHPSSTMQQWVLWLCLCLFYAYFDVLLICLQNIWIWIYVSCDRQVQSFLFASRLLDVRNPAQSHAFIWLSRYQNVKVILDLLQHEMTEVTNRVLKMCANHLHLKIQSNQHHHHQQTQFLQPACLSWAQPRQALII